MMARLLDSFGNRQPMLDGVSMNIHTFNSNRAAPAYSSHYEEPLQGLFDHGQAKVRLWARQELEQV